MSTTKIIGKTTTVDILPNGVFYTGDGFARYARFKKTQEIKDVPSMINSRHIEMRDDTGELLISISSSEFPDYDVVYNEILQAWRFFWFH